MKIYKRHETKLYSLLTQSLPKCWFSGKDNTALYNWSKIIKDSIISEYRLTAGSFRSLGTARCPSLFSPLYPPPPPPPFLIYFCLVSAVASQVTSESQEPCSGIVCVHSWYWHSVLPLCVKFHHGNRRLGILTEQQIIKTVNNRDYDNNISESSLSELSSDGIKKTFWNHQITWVSQHYLNKIISPFHSWCQSCNATQFALRLQQLERVPGMLYIAWHFADNHEWNWSAGTTANCSSYQNRAQNINILKRCSPWQF